MTSFGENLQRLLKQHRISVTQLAKEIGVSPKTVHEWVGKNSSMPRDALHLKRTADFFEVSLSQLLFGESERPDFGSILNNLKIHVGTYQIHVTEVGVRSTKNSTHKSHDSK